MLSYFVGREFKPEFWQKDILSILIIAYQSSPTLGQFVYIYHKITLSIHDLTYLPYRILISCESKGKYNTFKPYGHAKHEYSH